MGCDNKGRFRAYGLPPGRYAATAELGNTFPSQAVEVKAGEQDLRLTLPVVGPTSAARACAPIRARVRVG